MRHFLNKYCPHFLKKLLSRMISNAATGLLIAHIFDNKVPFRGLRIDTSSPRVRSKTASDLFFGFYERAEIDQIQRYLDPDVDVVELGGSIGVGSTVIRRKINASRKLVVIEADPDLAYQIQHNMRLNGILTDNVVIECKAIDYSGRDSVSFMQQESNLSGRYSAGQMGTGTIEVPTTTLSSILNRNELAEFSLISDIEGMEIPLFFQDEEALVNCRQVLIEIDGVEYKGQSLSVDDIERRINNLGFETVDRYHNVIAFRRQR